MSKQTVGSPVVIEFNGTVGLLRYTVKLNSNQYEEERWFWNSEVSKFSKEWSSTVKDVENLSLSFEKNSQNQTQYAKFALPFGIKWQRVTHKPPSTHMQITGFESSFDPDKEFVYIDQVLGEKMNIQSDTFVKIGDVYFIPFRSMTDKSELYFTNLGGFDLQNHQKAIRNKVRRGTRFKLLQHGMGTGKTISGLAIMEELIMRQMVNEFVVVVPDALTAEWQNEVREQGYNHIEKFIHFTTYSDIFKGEFEMNAQTGLLFDEMHRLFMQMNTVVESRISLQRTKIDQANFLLGKDYRDMYKAFQNITTAGALFGLTGTPIFSDIYDVAFLINLFSRCESGFDAYPGNKFDFYENCMVIDEARLRLLQTYQMLSTDLGTSDGVRQSIDDNFVDKKFQLSALVNQLVPKVLTLGTAGLLTLGNPNMVLASLGNAFLWDWMFGKAAGPSMENNARPRVNKNLKLGHWDFKNLDGENEQGTLVDFNVADWAFDVSAIDVLSSSSNTAVSLMTTAALSKFNTWYKNAKDNWMNHSQVFGQIKNILPIVNYVDYFDVRDTHRNLENGVALFPSIVYKTVRVSLDIYSIRMHMIRKRDEVLKWGSNKDLATLSNLRAIYGADDNFQNVEVYLQIRNLADGEMFTNLDEIGGLSKIDGLLRKAIGLDDMSISLCGGEDCDPQGKGGVLNVKLKMPGYMQLLFASHIAYLSEDLSLTAERGCNKAKDPQINGTIKYKMPFYEIYGCTRVNRTDAYCTPWVRYISFSPAYTMLEREKVTEQLRKDVFFNIKTIEELPGGKLKLEFKHVKHAEIFHKMFRDNLLHPDEPFQILLAESDVRQQTPITIDEARVTIKNIVSHITDSITPVDLKRISALPCPQRVKYPYPNKFYALFYNFLLDGDQTQNAGLGDDKRGELVVSMPTKDRSHVGKATRVNVCEPELFQTNLIEKKDSGFHYIIPEEPPPLSPPSPFDDPRYMAIRLTKQAAKGFTKTVGEMYSDSKASSNYDDDSKDNRERITRRTFYDYNISPLCAVYSQYINELGGLLTLRDFLLRQDLSARNRNVYMYRGGNFWTVADHIRLHRPDTQNSSTSLVWPEDFKRIEKSKVKTTDYVFSVLGVPERHLIYMDENDEIYDEYVKQKQTNPNVKIKDIRIQKHHEWINQMRNSKKVYMELWDREDPDSVASFEGERITMHEWNILKDPFKFDKDPTKLKGIDLGGGRRVQLSLLLINRQATEGLSISNLRQMHVLEPIEDAGQFHQVIARGARTASHGTCTENGTEVNKTYIDKYCSNMYIQAITWYSFIPQQHGFIGVYQLPLTTFNMFAKIMREFAETHLYVQSYDIEKSDLLGFGRVTHAIRKHWGKWIDDRFRVVLKGSGMRFVEKQGSYIFGYDIDDEAETLNMSEFKLRTKYRTFAKESYNELQDMMFDIMKTTLFHTSFFETSDDVAARNFVKSNKQSAMYEKINNVISCGVYHQSNDINECRTSYADFSEFDYLDCNRGVTRSGFKEQYRGLPLKESEFKLSKGLFDATDEDVPVKKKEVVRNYAFMQQDIGKICKVVHGRVAIDGRVIHKARVHPRLKIMEAEIIAVEEIENGNVKVKNLGENGDAYNKMKKLIEEKIKREEQMPRSEELEELKEKELEQLKTQLNILYKNQNYITFKNTFINYNKKERYFDTLTDMDIHMNSFDNVTLYEYTPPSTKNEKLWTNNNKKRRDQTILYPFGPMEDNPSV